MNFRDDIEIKNINNLALLFYDSTKEGSNFLVRSLFSQETMMKFVKEEALYTNTEG